MELVNATKMQAGYTMGMRPDGRELLVVVAKGTFRIPLDGGECTLADEQVRLVEADAFTGEPGFSAPVYESDYAPVKKRCDVVLLGSAYAPNGSPAQRVRVSLSVGSIHKEFDVVGDRVWLRTSFGLEASQPEYFSVMPLSYDRAFGGVDNLENDPNSHVAFTANPVGRGFHPKSAAGLIDGKPLPNIEEPGHAVDSPRTSYRPMGFGPIGRNWQPRPSYAGTYDQNWVDNVFPFLPADFDDRYYQCAPEDQQVDDLRGQEVVLVNLTAEGRTRFRVPALCVPVTFYLKNFEQREVEAVPDTLVIEPELNRITMTWRASLPLRRNMFEVAQVVAGRMPAGWYRARKLGKTYYRSLKEAVDTRRAQREPEPELAMDEEGP